MAYLTGSTGADFGVMLSASHNPMPDNGIKFFARGGTKLDDALEDAIEARLGERWARPIGAAVGRVRDEPSLVEAYIAHLVGSLERPVSLDGITVVVDCANGAAYQTAPAAFESQGAKVIRIHAEPDGTNINENAGSTHMDALRATVVEHGADLGIALDGDADRCLAVDATGRTVDGDQALAILALALRDAGRLANNTVVATVMSNLGFFRAMESAGITVEQTKVGDRYVLEAMRADGFFLGGEQSGHVVLLEHATTGDGVLTGLHLMSRMAADRTVARRPGLGDGAASPGAGQRAGCRQGSGRLRPGARRGRAVGGGRSRQNRSGSAATLRHGVAGAGDGRGRDAGAGRRGRPAAGRRRTGPPLSVTRARDE